MWLLQNLPGESHTESMIVASLPRQRILFQGDLLNLPDAGSPAPAIQLTVEGLQAIKRLGLEPLKIAGVHGEVGTLEDWQRELDARSSASSVRGSAPRSAGP